MNVPTGYTALDMIGFTDKGVYNSATAYVKNDIVHYNGNLWKCLVDDTTAVTPAEGASWTVFLAEPTSAAEDIIATVEPSVVSTHQYTAGKQLILNDILYTVTAAVNIGDTLAVGTNIVASDTIVEQLTTKANTSSLATVATSGSYADLSNKPTLGTAAAKDVPASGNASTTEVVMGDDTRLSNDRNAADVYPWAKAANKPIYNGSEINTSAAQTGTAQSAVAATIASGTSMDAAIGDLLDNDVTINTDIGNVKQALSNHWGTVNLFNKYLMDDVVTDLQYKTLTLKANTTYIASTDLPINSNNNANFFAYNSSGSANTNTNGLWQGQTRNITTGSDGIVIVAYRTVNFTNTSVEWFLSHNFQIEEGSTATSFQPYAKPNTELTQETKDLIDNAFANGAVNALENTAAATAVNGVTFIVNADKTVTVSTGAGGATANANLAINQTISELDIPKGTWVLSSGISDANCYLSAMAYNGTTWVKNFGNTSQGDLTMNVDYSGYDTIRVYLVVVSGSIYTTSKTVKPMIAKAGFTDYVIHAKSNRELTDGMGAWENVQLTNSMTGGVATYGFVNKSLKLAIVCINSGTSSDTTGTINVSNMPPKYDGMTSALRNKGYLMTDVNNKTIKVAGMTEPYTVGQIVYPIA